MKIEHIDVDAAIDSVKQLLDQERDLSPALKSAMQMLLLLVSLLLNRTTLNSKNSSKPPSTDPHREKRSNKGRSELKPGGQKGHIGTTLQKVNDPDVVKELKVNRHILPKGRTYKEFGYEARQVIDLDISRIVTEFRAQVLKDEHGNRFVAKFPASVGRTIQYGASVKANAVYMSQFQLLPYDRIRDQFADQMGVPVSVGSIFNFNKQAYHALDDFEQWAKGQLVQSDLVHADETGININGKGHWLHCASNSSLTLLYPHAKRGTDAMNDMGVLPLFKGVLCHDHWKPYYRYDCSHSLCNAHHLRELERAGEQDGQQWAAKMQALLIEINVAVDDAGGQLDPNESKRWRIQYRKLLEEADQECPAPDESLRKAGSGGRIKRSKARNLLERLQKFEHDVLRFMDVENVPFTNNLGERDLRMTKVQQKISGCFRSMEGAKIFCRVRSYLSTCRKQGLSATRALDLLFKGKKPEFMKPNDAQV